MNLYEGLTTTGEFGNDRFRRRNPNKWLRVVVPDGQELFDCGLKIGDGRLEISRSGIDAGNRQKRIEWEKAQAGSLSIVGGVSGVVQVLV